MDDGDGKIHHWVGTVLMPKVKLDRVIGFVQVYERYPEIFGSMIPRARVINRSPTRFDVAMRTSSSKYGVTVAYDGDYGIDYRQLSPTRVFTKSVVTNLHYVEDAGKPNERRMPGDRAPRGYLWRLTCLPVRGAPRGHLRAVRGRVAVGDPGWFLSLTLGWVFNDIPRVRRWPRRSAASARAC